MIARNPGKISLLRQVTRRTAVLVVMLSFISCGDPYLHNISKSSIASGNNTPAPPSPNRPILEESTPWDWAENIDTIIAPWAHQLTDEDIEHITITENSVTIPAARFNLEPPADSDSSETETNNGEAIENNSTDNQLPYLYEVNDILWLTTKDNNFVRRIVSITESGSNFEFITQPAQLDELFFKVFIQETISDAFNFDASENEDILNVVVCANEDNSSQLSLCDSGDDNAVMDIELLSQGVVSGSDAILTIGIDFFQPADEQCACLTQYYGNDGASLQQECGINPQQGSMELAINTLKGQCRATPSTFRMHLEGSYHLNIAQLAVETTDAIQFSADLPDTMTSSVSVPFGPGYITLEYALQSYFAVNTKGPASLGWSSNSIPLTASISSGLNIQWPHTPPNNKRSRIELLDESQLTSTMLIDDSNMALVADDDSSFELEVRLQMNSTIMGMEGPHATMIGSRIETATNPRTVFNPDYETPDPNGEDDPDDYDVPREIVICNNSLLAGMYLEVDLMNKLPFPGLTDPTPVYKKIDTCNNSPSGWNNLCTIKEWASCGE